MPYVLWKKNGKRQGTPFVFTAGEVDNLARDCDNTYTLLNTTTRRLKTVGGKGPCVNPIPGGMRRLKRKGSR